MGNRSETQLDAMLRSAKRRRWQSLVLLCLAVVVAVGVAGIFHHTAIAKTYQVTELTCTAVPPEGAACADYFVHIHNDDCFDASGNLVCPLPEIRPHRHTSDCFVTTRELICTTPESDGHRHTEDCYARVQGELICTLSTEPVLDEEGNVLEEGHVHTDECFTWTEELSCGMEEGQGAHRHDDSCYVTSTTLTCAEPEILLHTHTDACYQKNEDGSLYVDEDGNTWLICGQLQVLEHVHGPECFTVYEWDDGEAGSTENTEGDGSGLVFLFPEEEEEEEQPAESANPEAETGDTEVTDGSNADPADGNTPNTEEAADAEETENTEATDPETDVQSDKTAADADKADDAENSESTGDTEPNAEGEKQEEPPIAEEPHEVVYTGTRGAEKSGITVLAEIPEGALDESAQLVLSDADESAARKQILKLVNEFAAEGEEREISSMLLMDIGFVSGGEPAVLQGTDPIRVTLRATAIRGMNAPKLFHLSGGTAQKVEDVIFDTQAGSVVFTSTTFSPFAIVDLTGEDPADETAEETVIAGMPAQNFTGETESVIVSVEAPEGAFPAGTTMVITPVDMDDETLSNVTGAVESSGEKKVVTAQAVDISFFDAGGNLIEPNLPIKVSMKSALVSESENVALVHLAETGAAETAETEISEAPAVTTAEVVADVQVVENPDEDNEIQFESDAFSVYVLVGTETITTNYITADGETYSITVTYGPEAMIPAGATLAVAEIPQDSEEYTILLAQAQSAVNKNAPAETNTAEIEEAATANEDDAESTADDTGEAADGVTVTTARFFDITILDADGNPVEPAAPVDVKIEYMEPAETAENYQVVHFGAETEVLNPAVSGTDGTASAFDFQASSFSVFGVVGTERITRVIVTGSGETVQITVEVTDKKDIARLKDIRVTELDVESNAYLEAYDAVVAAKKAETETFDESNLGFFAADIALLNENGEEFEPAGTVSIKMELIRLPSDEDTLLSTMEVQHLVEQGGRIDVQTVASGGNITKVNEVITAVFSVESFSTFTLTWTDDGSSAVISDKDASTILNIQNESGDTYATVTVHYVDTNGNKILSLFTSAVNGTTPVTIDGLLNSEIAGYEYQGAHYNSYNGESINSIEVTRDQTTTTGDVYTYLGTTSDSFYGYGGGQLNNSSTAPSEYSEFYADAQGNTRIYFKNQRFRRSDDKNGQVYVNGPVYGKSTGTITGYNYELSFDNSDIAELTNTNTTGTWNDAADIYLVYSSEEELSAATIHYGERVNGQFVEFGSEKVAILDTSAGSVSIANYFDGYVYSIAHYQAGNQEDYVIDPNLYKVRGENDKYNWQADMYVTNGSTDTTTKVRRPIADGSDIYVEYVKRGEGSANPPTPEGVEGPETHKSVYPTLNAESDEDGTYTIRIDVTGNVKQEVNKIGANVMIVLDRTKSMRYNMYDDTVASSEANNRWTAALGAVDVLLETLSTGLNANNDVEYSLMTFYQRADAAVSWNDSNWTRDAKNVSTAVHNATPIGKDDNTNNGTNWEDPLYRAGLLLNEKQNTDTDKTYIIFVTDGQPNARGTGENGNPYTGYQSNGQTAAYNAALPYAKALYENSNAVLYGVFCGMSSGHDTLDSLLSTAAAEAGVSNRPATIDGTDEDAIKNAFRSIAQTIINNLGANNVSVDDGVTTLSSVSAQVAGEAGAFEYYRKGGKNADNTEKYDSSANGGLGETWVDAPGASYSHDNGVTWDLSSVGVLEEGVTYTVRFKVWPSQNAYDLIANLNNGLVDFDSLDQSVKDQVGRRQLADGSYFYYLLTNTHLYTTYTYDGNTYTDPIDWNIEEMQLLTRTMKVQKAWSNELDDRGMNSAQLIVTKDGTDYLFDSHSVTVSHPTWTSEPFYISCGLISTKGDADHSYIVHEKGHDYSVREPEDYAYYWNLTADVYRPMIINNNENPTMLIKRDKKPNGTEGVDYFVIEDNYYEVIQSTEVILHARNERRSNLNLTKEIVGETDEQSADTLFTYKATIGEAGERDIWFSCWDGTGYADITRSDNVKKELDGQNAWTGYYYVPSGEEFTISIKSGWNVRFINLPNDTEYKFEEAPMPDDFTFVDAECSAITYEKTGANEWTEIPDTTYKIDVDSDTATVSGDIPESNHVYSVKFKNRWEPSNKLIVRKVWNSGDYVLTHGTVQVALFKNVGGVLTFVEGTVKQIAAPNVTVVYAGLEGELSEYVVREVTVTQDGETITVTPISPDGMIAVEGEVTQLDVPATSEDTAEVYSDTYFVTYTQGTESTDERGKPLREDTVTNTMPTLSVIKTDLSDRPLPGAVFRLLDENKTPINGYESLTTTEENSCRILNEVYLSNGIYYLEETDAPDGFVRLSHRIKIIISGNGTNYIRVISDADVHTPYTVTNENNVYTFKVVNNPGIELPQTGGIGTTLFTAIGGIMTALAGAVLTLKRRKEHA